MRGYKISFVLGVEEYKMNPMESEVWVLLLTKMDRK